MGEFVNLDEFLANICIYADKFHDVQSYMDTTGAIVYKPKLAHAPVPLSRIYSRTSMNGPFELIRGFIRGHSSPFLYIPVVFFSCV